MNVKRWALAGLAVFVVAAILDGLVHGVLLADLYRQTASVWRPEAEMEKLMPLIMWIGNLVFALAFVLIYGKGDTRRIRAGSAKGYATA